MAKKKKVEILKSQIELSIEREKIFMQLNPRGSRNIQNKILQIYTFGVKSEFNDFINYMKNKVKRVNLTKVNNKKNFVRLDGITLKTSCKIYSYIKSKKIKDFSLTGESYNFKGHGDTVVINVKI